MTIIQAIILSIVEGITEFLPVSSTGHLILTSTWLGVPQSAFTTSFELFIQLGAILSVVLLYGKSIVSHVSKLKHITYAFIPTAIVGFVLYKFIKAYLLNNAWVVVISLFVGGIALIAVELFFRHKNQSGISTTELSPRQAVYIGLFQSLSVIPGVSRAAATIIGGQFVGLSRVAAVEFSFLLAIPTMLAATGLDLLKTDSFSFSANELGLMMVGFFVSFCTALIVVKLFLTYIKNNSFIGFGIYRMCIAVLYCLFVLS